MTFSAYALRQSSASTIAHFFDRLFSQQPRHRAYLDVRDLPDHLKRDIGFLDGKEPSGSIR